MYFTKEERNIIEKHLPLIEQIVKTSSSSYISIEAREELLEIAVNHKLASCKTCTSGLFIAVVRIYGHYVEDMNELKANQQEKSINTKNKKSKK